MKEINGRDSERFGENRRDWERVGEIGRGNCERMEEIVTD